MPPYNPRVIEPKWQGHWERNKTFRVVEDPNRPKLYVLDMFPYPSGEGLHVGHPEGYTATDMWCRYKRMRGYNVLHPMGYDAFGLPAEQYAIQTGTHPRIKTEENIANIRRQIKRLGFSYDWDREFATTDTGYVKWTQWIFLVLHDTWFDREREWSDSQGRRRRGKGRPISELPIPPEIRGQGDEALRRYQDSFRLAYQTEAPVNWCQALGTVLADEEVINGRSERGDHPVQRIPLRQWMLRITAYADLLVEDLDWLDWPGAIKEMQRNWVGRSEGAELDFYVGPADAFGQWQKTRSDGGFPPEPGGDSLRVYTTRPDTLFGATYIVLAPEHPLVNQLTTSAVRAEVDDYRQRVSTMSEEDRIAGRGEKTGVFTGGYAINPADGQAIAVWIADYVLISYGSGAIMAVPAHDQRDFEFARLFSLPIRPVILPPEPWLERHAAPLAGQNQATSHKAFVQARDKDYYALVDAAFSDDGSNINSSGPQFSIDGLATHQAKQRITQELAARGLSQAAVKYKLRDWLFSRQRYWGEPFPILHEVDEQGNPTGLTRRVPEEQLPVELPELDDFKPTGQPEPPLEKATSWVWVEQPAAPGQQQARFRRETNTMPQWAGSCWYYLRFCDPKNNEQLSSPERERYWMPVDLYVGGAEHAVLHLLYARFWHKVLYDRGHVSTPEPFRRLINQGMILSVTFRTANGRIVPYTDIKFSEGKATHAETGEQLAGETEKMSKARGNVVPVDVPLERYGADATRLYEMFMGPLEQTKPWSMHGVEGINRFLNRAWRMVVDEAAGETRLNPAVVKHGPGAEPTGDQLRVLHKTVKEVTQDVEALRFNTAIARLMEFVNFFTTQPTRPRCCMEPFVLMLAPLAPHIAEELWETLGQSDSVAYAPWPDYDEEVLRVDTIELPIQINGKVRSRMVVLVSATKEELEQAALADPKIKGFLDGRQVQRIIVVPNKLINIVLS